MISQSVLSWMGALVVLVCCPACGDGWHVREEFDLEPATICSTPELVVGPLPTGPDEAEPPIRRASKSAPASTPKPEPMSGGAQARGETEHPAKETSSVSPERTCVDLNTATPEQLVTLPGVGPTRAEAIVRERARRPFEKRRHLMRIRGIGRATFRKLEDRLCPL